MVLAGSRGQNRANQFRIGGQRNIFPGTGLDGIDGQRRVVRNAGGNDQNVYAFGFKAGDKLMDIQPDVYHYQFDGFAGAQYFESAFNLVSQRNVTALSNGNFARRSDLSV